VTHHHNPFALFLLIGFLSCQLWARAADSVPEQEYKTSVIKVKSSPSVKSLPSDQSRKAPTQQAKSQSQSTSAITYTTKVISVPNTTHYLPYKSSVQSHTASKAAVTFPRPNRVLQAQVDSTVIAEHRGYDASAQALITAAPPMGTVKSTNVSDQAFKRWLHQYHADIAQESVPVHSIIVIKGKWDHAEHILKAAGLPCDLVDGHNLQNHLLNAALLVINCPGELDASAENDVRHFVENGGYLITTDWTLGGCLQDIFPGYVSWNGAYSHQGIVDGITVEPDNELLTRGPALAPWVLDDKSEIVRLNELNPVDVLVRSRALSADDPANLGVLAVTFNPGKGKVLHLVGHFNNNTNLAFNSALPDPAPGSTISLRQIIALNFVAEALKINRSLPPAAAPEK